MPLTEYYVLARYEGSLYGPAVEELFDNKDEIDEDTVDYATDYMYSMASHLNTLFVDEDTASEELKRNTLAVECILKALLNGIRLARLSEYSKNGFDCKEYIYDCTNNEKAYSGMSESLYEALQWLVRMIMLIQLDDGLTLVGETRDFYYDLVEFTRSEDLEYDTFQKFVDYLVSTNKKLDNITMLVAIAETCTCAEIRVMSSQEQKEAIKEAINEA